MSTKKQKKLIGAYKLTLSLTGDRNGTLLVEPIRDHKGVLCGHKFRYSEGRGTFKTDGFLAGTDEDKAPETLSRCMLQVKNAKELRVKGLKYCLSCLGSGVSKEDLPSGSPRKLCDTCKGTGVVPMKSAAPTTEDPMVITYRRDM